MRRASGLFWAISVWCAVSAGPLRAQDWLAGFSVGVGSSGGNVYNEAYCWAGLAVTQYDEIAYYSPVLSTTFSGNSSPTNVEPPYTDNYPGEIDTEQTLSLSQNQLYDCQIDFAAEVSVPVDEDPGDGIVGDPYGLSLVDFFGVGDGGAFLDSGFYGTDYPTFTADAFTVILAEYDLAMYLGAPLVESVNSNPTPVAGQSAQTWTVDLIGQFLMLYYTDVDTGQQTPYPSTVVLNDGNGQPVQAQPTITAQTDTDMTLSVPAALTAGSYSLVVTTSIGWTTSTNFTVGDPTPSISSVTPGMWLAGLTTNVTVQGSGFGTSPQPAINDGNVTFDTPVACAGYSTTDTCFTVNATVAPSDPGGPYNLTVTSQGYGNGFFSGGPGNPPQGPTEAISIAPIQLSASVAPPAVPNDGDAVIATQQFSLQVVAHAPNSNTPLAQVSTNATITWSYSLPGETLPSSVHISQGVGTVNVVLNGVSGTSQTRTYTINVGQAITTGGINVWFSVESTDEGLVGNPTACNHIIVANDHFVALPSTGLCCTAVVLTDGTDGAYWEHTTVLDVGPWYPHSQATPGNPCVGPNDPYWNTSGVPRAESDTCSNGAGIDLADGTFNTLGKPASVLWRFGQ